MTEELEPRTVQSYYDAFAQRLLRDYLIPNRRIIAQMDFLRDAIPQSAARVLVAGSGTGQTASYIARRLARRATVLGIDISPVSNAIANRLFGTRRLSFQSQDLRTGSIEGRWEVIVLPDVYEHVPIGDRPAVHSRLDAWLADKGRLILTLPSPAYQRFLRQQGEGLQIIDEIVTLNDLGQLAADVNGTITYYALVSAFRTNDYIHTILERRCDYVAPITQADRLAVKRKRGLLATAWRFAVGPGGLLYWPYRRLRMLGVRRLIRQSESPDCGEDRPRSMERSS